MNTNNFNFSGMRNAYQLLTNSKTPLQLFQQLAGNNPNFQPVLQMLQQGRDPQQIFNILCQQRGINPQEFIKNITGK